MGKETKRFSEYAVAQFLRTPQLPTQLHPRCPGLQFLRHNDECTVYGSITDYYTV